MLLMIEKEIRGRLYNSTNKNAKVDKRYMQHLDKKEESSYLKYWDISSLYGWEMSLRLSKTELIELKMFLNLIKTSQKDSKEKVTDGILLNLILNVLIMYMNF